MYMLSFHSSPYTRLVASRRTETLPKCFGLAYIDDIVEGTVDIDKLASVQIGAVGYTCI